MISVNDTLWTNWLLIFASKAEICHVLVFMDGAEIRITVLRTCEGVGWLDCVGILSCYLIHRIIVHRFIVLILLLVNLIHMKRDKLCGASRVQDSSDGTDFTSDSLTKIKLNWKLPGLPRKMYPYFWTVKPNYIDWMQHTAGTDYAHMSVWGRPLACHHMQRSLHPLPNDYQYPRDDLPFGLLQMTRLRFDANIP